MALNPRQARFVEEYLVDLNATQAAIRAGYSEKTARQMAAENLAKPEISEAIQAARAERSARTKLGADWVVEKLKDIVEVNTETVTDPDTGVSTMVDPKAANGALQMLGKHLGMFIDKQEIVTTRYVARIPAPAQTVDSWLQESK